MSEFIEIDDYVLRRSEISHVTEIKTGCVVKFVDGKAGRFSEPYKSVRDKLLGKPSPDLRKDFVDGLVSHLKQRGMHGRASIVTQYYQSTMLSEMEGAG